ncbi:TetR/AcrR family transcriptional regulator [Streptomyces leeuwenhoekii]|uniref:HTH-type transcriptional repressor KstR2 n=1 Tax=Streptomyces leeuwenhoekii TaxID=1437453 RepID=A0A0F7W6S2_STRLW|nr:TetR/AcrR family transcriptional regulator [Streptomyces leeuwenhoekii]CQR65577.1 HTH-type transcriptional repressor KstR2 [Streptomyces leeuwenhoekii]
MARQTSRTKQPNRVRGEDPQRGFEPDPGADWRHFEELRLSPFLEAALEEFGAHGYHGGSVRAIANRVGVTLPTLYYHHGSKQDLLVTLLMGSMRDILVRCHRALAEAGDRPEDQVAQVVECFTLYMAHRRRLAFLDGEVRNLEPENRERYIALRNELTVMLRRVVDDGVARGVFGTPYPTEAVRAVVSMCQAVAVWFRPEGPLTEAEVAQRFVALALDTLASGQRGKRSVQKP